MKPSIEKHIVKVLTFAQVLNGLGVAGTVAACLLNFKI
jgi:hypothetical protein